MRAPRLFHALAALLLLGLACGRSAFDGSPGGGSPIPTSTVTPPVSPSPSATGTPDFGDGSAGNLTVPLAGVPLNICHRILSASGTSATVNTATSFGPGRRYLFLQVTDAFATADSANATGAPGAAGRWELGRVVTISGTTLTLADSLTNNYASDGTRTAEICTFPEFANVSVPPGRSLVASPWDGNVGGVLAFAVSGTLSLSGSLDATANGFRGGVRGGISTGQTTAWDTSSSDGGGKGEGIDERSRARFGRGCYRIAGGSGNARKGGAGGGANGGNGGKGGNEEGGQSNSYGVGGVAVDGSSLQLYLGGAGGAAHQDSLGGAGLGGDGGGIVLIFTSVLSGAGSIAADGKAGTDSIGSSGGGGGGGAGGTIALRTGDAAGFTGMVHATGKNGGSLQDASGPGGGGGGGRIFVRAGLTGAATAGGGANGLTNAAAARGATSGSPGLVVVPLSF